MSSTSQPSLRLDAEQLYDVLLKGVRKLLDIFEKDIRTSMVLTGVKSVREIGPEILA